MHGLLGADWIILAILLLLLESGALFHLIGNLAIMHDPYEGVSE